MAKQALLHFKNVKKSFSGNVVLSGVDFEIDRGALRISDRLRPGREPGLV